MSGLLYLSFGMEAEQQPDPERNTVDVPMEEDAANAGKWQLDTGPRVQTVDDTCSGHSSFNNEIFNILVSCICKKLFIRDDIKLPFKICTGQFKQLYGFFINAGGRIDIGRNDDFTAGLTHPLQFFYCGVGVFQQMNYVSGDHFIKSVTAAF